VSRYKSPVKNKLKMPHRTGGLVDLHFHGAFGIDLMSADRTQLNRLSAELWKHGIAGFCATTLSGAHAELLAAVTRLGAWIRSGEAPGAQPLGIHLEGPYVHPGACGAHPPGAIRELSMTEIQELWDASQGTLKILTVAPERLSPELTRQLTRWARKNRVVLSLGHSRATEEQAISAFKSGFSGVTHAWNALAFHHRAPGPLGAALGNPKVYVELIIDLIHVSPTLIRWTQKLHPKGVCFVSDCAPAAATSGKNWFNFGTLKTRFQDGACRLDGGALAGGGLLLGKAYQQWLKTESRLTGRPISDLLKKTVHSLTTRPLEALQLTPKERSALSARRVEWNVSTRGQITLKPL
jgi:N-acetylglucosamine-6-phosphate deacetylase